LLLLVTYDDGATVAVVAYERARAVEDDGQVVPVRHLQAVAISVDAQRRGLGTDILEAVIAETVQRDGEGTPVVGRVHRDNTACIALMERFGFTADLRASTDAYLDFS
jgi:ribosomal protein S18 acetylase RimI-like enzyme